MAYNYILCKKYFVLGKDGTEYFEVRPSIIEGLFRHTEVGPTFAYEISEMVLTRATFEVGLRNLPTMLSGDIVGHHDDAYKFVRFLRLNLDNVNLSRGYLHYFKQLQCKKMHTLELIIQVKRKLHRHTSGGHGWILKFLLLHGRYLHGLCCEGVNVKLFVERDAKSYERGFEISSSLDVEMDGFLT